MDKVKRRKVGSSFRASLVNMLILRAKILFYWPTPDAEALSQAENENVNDYCDLIKTRDE